MSILQSKDVDLVIGKDNIVDLYDEQIDTNKDLSQINKSDIAKLTGRLLTLETYSENFNNRLTYLESSAGSAKYTDLVAIKNDISVLQAKDNQLGNSISSLESTMSVLQSKVNTLTSGDLTTQIKTAGEKAQQASSDVATLKKTVDKINETSTNYGLRITTIESELSTISSSLTNSLGEAETDIGGLKTKIDRNTSNISKNTTDIANLNTQMTKANKSIGNLDDLTKNLQVTVGGYDAKFKSFAETDTIHKGWIETNANEIERAFHKITEIDEALEQVKGFAYDTTAKIKEHTHDDRYYTETEMDTKLNAKADKSHTHDDRYYTETEMDTKLNAKANKANPTFTGTATMPTLKVTTALYIPGGQLWIE